MSEGGGIKLKFFEKLKKIKHIEIYVLLIFVAIIGLVFYSTKRTTISKTDTTTVNSYISSMESRLEKILSNIEGVSNAKVMISIDTSDLSTSKTNDDQYPPIKGIIITAKGVDDTKTKMNVLHAVETVLDINSHNIQIFVSN